MYKQHLLDNMEREIKLLKKMSTHIEERDLDFRPAEKTRSTIELMRYVGCISSTMLRWFIIDDITKEVWDEVNAAQMDMTIENFPAKIDQEWATIKAYMDTVTEDDLMNKEVAMPWREKMPLGSAIINAPVKWLSSYRMQLFLYLKMNGRPHLGTRDAWVGEPAVKAAV